MQSTFALRFIDSTYLEEIRFEQKQQQKIIFDQPKYATFRAHAMFTHDSIRFFAAIKYTLCFYLWLLISVINFQKNLARFNFSFANAMSIFFESNILRV